VKSIDCHPSLLKKVSNSFSILPSNTMMVIKDGQHQQPWAGSLTQSMRGSMMASPNRKFGQNSF
jgi:hypothetical protein